MHEIGHHVMTGLIAGIRSELPGLTGTLGSITDTIGSIGGMRPAQVSLAGAAGAGGGSVTVNLNARTVDVTAANIRPLINASLLHARLGRPR